MAPDLVTDGDIEAAALRGEPSDDVATAVFLAMMTAHPPKGWRLQFRDTTRHATYFVHRDGRRFMIETRPGERAAVTAL